MLSVPEQRILLNLARKTLESLEDGDAASTYEEFLNDSSPLTDNLKSPLACFVCLRTHSGSLRGCLGNTSSTHSLFSNVHHTTLDSALRDPRFPPIASSEVAHLRVEVSVISPMQPLLQESEISVGRHGVFVRHQSRSAALLAGKAIEMGWSAREFLAAAAREAGLFEADLSRYEWYFFEEFSFREEQPLRLQ